MDWLFEIHKTQPIAHAIGVIAFVCVAGMAFGSLKFRGIGLGTAGVLFAGILVGHFGEAVDHHTLDFVKEFGLILFVFTIGLQLGPGFVAALRQQGVKLNVLAASVVIFGAASAALIGWLAGFDPAAVLGIFSGASTNTPSLGAGTQTLGTIPGVGADRLTLPALSYAVTYPTAIVGIIGTLVLLKQIYRIDIARETADFSARNRPVTEPLERRTLVVTNPNLEGVRLDAIPGRLESRVTISRVRHGEDTRAATDATVVHRDDRLAVVGTRDGLEKFERVVGQRSDEDLVLTASDITYRRVVVTARGVLGKTVGELGLDDRFGVAVTRVTRADLEMSAVPGLRLQFGDQVQIVGAPADLDKAAGALGNSLKELNETHFIPFFIGIALGIALGTLPMAFPGLPQPVKLGLAGGPLIVALILGRVGRIRRQVWHMPVNTNLAFREFGIALFFAAVGLGAGARFFATVFSATGLQWLLAGIVVTVLPIFLIGIFARSVWKLNYLDISGLIAGSMTDPPALAFASNVAGSSAPTVAYATVYPLTTLMRILGAQNPCHRSMRMKIISITQLGEARHASPASFPVGDEIFTPADVQWPGGKLPDDLMLFEKAGPRKNLFFDPKETRAAIVTCGGLCPGLNNVIRSVTRELYRGYGVQSVLGIRGGYRGLDPNRGKPPLELTDDVVEDIHKDGGTMLGTSRGPVDMGVAVEFLISRNVNMLFTVGGDGTQRGGNELFEQARKRGHALAVVGIPKTIDNDVRFVSRTFGFATAVDEAVHVINSAHTEARCVDNGVSVVKLMGRHAGFIAAAATVASQDVNLCLVPEVPFVLDGPGGLLAALERRLEKKHHAVVVAAEGAGQDLLGASGEKDASGNVKLNDIGHFLRDAFHAHFKARGIEITLRYFDPSYLIRGCPANTEDALLCDRMGRHAVHAAMAGKTGLVISFLNGQFVHVPISVIARGSKCLDLEGELWRAVLSSTCQPPRFS